MAGYQNIDERYIEWIALGIDFLVLALLSLIADFFRVVFWSALFMLRLNGQKPRGTITF